MMRKIMLVCFALIISAAGANAQCDLSSGFENYVVLTEGDFEVTLATDQGAYTVGDVVEFELIVKNISEGSVLVEWPVTVPQAICVTSPDCTVIHDCYQASVYSYPPWLMYVNGEMTLAPGECRKYSMTWDMVEDPAPSGSYLVWGGLFAWTIDIQVPLGQWILPSAGLTLGIELLEPVSNTELELDAVKALYR